MILDYSNPFSPFARMVASFPLAKEVYKRQHEFNRDFNSIIGAYPIDVVLRDMLGAMTGDDWSRIHRLFSAGFSHQFVQQVTDNVFLPEAFKWVKELSTKQDKFDPTAECGRFALSMMERIIYGDQFFQDPMWATRMDAILNLRLSLFADAQPSLLTKFAFYRHLPTALNRNIAKFCKDWAQFNVEYMSKYGDDLTSATILGPYKAMQAGKISEREFLDTLDELIFTNIELLGAVCSWCLIHLAQNSEVQTRLRGEIVAQDEANLWNYATESNTFLDMCIKESGRISPVLPFSVPEFLSEDVDVEGFRVKAGSGISVDYVSINRDEMRFGANVAAYRPERFEKLDLRMSEVLIFGPGPRKCLGYRYANRIMSSLVVAFIRDHEIVARDEIRRGPLPLNFPVTALSISNI
jgi:cytochrome P450